MNINQARQLIENNWLYGENGRRPDADRPRMAVTTLIQPDYSRQWGCDVSDWDGRVDLSVTKSKGASFVIIKAIDGTVPSRYFPENYVRAVSAGLARSAYAWLYRNVNVSCVAQAQAYNTLMNKYPPSFGPAIDFESTKWQGVYSNPTFNDLRIWATEWLRLGNPKPYLYSGKYYMDQYGAMPSDLKAMFAGLWIANYGTVTPGLPLGWQAWKLWQFSSSGDARLLAPNSTGKLELDLNYEQDAVTIPPQTGEKMFFKVTAAALNLRSTAENLGTANDIGDLSNGDIVETPSTSVPNGGVTWREVLRIWRNNVPVPLPASPLTGKVWAAEKGGEVYMAVTQFTPPDTTPTNKPARIDMTLAGGSVVTIKDTNGNTLWTGTA